MVFSSQTPWYKRLELHRCNMDQTQAETAEAIGIPVRTYQRWEHGEHVPTPQLRKRISKALGIDEGDIFGDNPMTRANYQVGGVNR